MQYTGVKDGIIKLSPQPLQIDGQAYCMVFTEVDTVDTLRHFPTYTIPRYTLYSSPSSKVFFTEDNLPPFLRVKYTLIKALPQDDLYSLSNNKIDATVFEADCYIHHKYTKNYPEFKTIGWQVSSNIYVIVMTKDELNNLITYDTRKEN
jgi:hypothetical protein